MKKILFALFLLFSFVAFADELPDKVVTFSFNNISIDEVFRAISKSTNVNIIVSADINKSITIELSNTNLSTAVDLITKTNDLDYIYTDGVLLIDTKENIYKFKEDDDSDDNNDKDKDSIINIVPDRYIYTNDDINVDDKDIEEDIFEDIIGSPICMSDNTSISIPSFFNNEHEDNIVEEKYRVYEGLSKGLLIPVKLDIGMISTTAQCPIRAIVTHDIALKGQILIPKGSIFSGYGVPDYGVRLIFGQIDTLVIGDREIDVNAHLVKDDGTPGFCSEYRDLEMEKFWPTIAMNFVTDLTSVFKDKKVVVDNYGNAQEVEEVSVKNEMIEKSQSAMDRWTDQVLQDARDHKAIISVNAGLHAFIFIDEKIPVEFFINE